jgi:hypothetical protein
MHMSGPSTLPPKALGNQGLPAPSRDEDARLNAMADEDIANDVGVPLAEAIAWVESWGSPDELPTPKARKLA